jgi:hypothetical protein
MRRRLSHHSKIYALRSEIVYGSSGWVKCRFNVECVVNGSMDGNETLRRVGKDLASKVPAAEQSRSNIWA